MTDKELAAACARRTEGAWETLLSTHAAGVLNEARRTVRSVLGRDDPALAEDIAAELFALLVQDDYRLLRSFGPPHKLAGYLALITRRRAINILTRDRDLRLRSIDFPASDSGQTLAETLAATTGNPFDRASGNELIAIIRQAMEDLPERDRTVIHRFYLQGESYIEIARALDVTVKVVSVAMVRAKERLLKLLHEKKII
jgi:RNA polymerase sigma-70 factor, ECF subfamily